MLCAGALALSTAGFTTALAAVLPAAPSAASTAATLPVSVASVPAAPLLDPLSEQLARQAWLGFQRGDPQPAQAALAVLRGRDLQDWIAYWALEPRLGQATQQDFDDYARAWPGTLPLRRLRAQWLFELARRKDWSGFSAVYSGYDGDDPQLQCLMDESRFETGNIDTSAQVLRLWTRDPAGGSGCNSAATSLLQAGRIGQRALWGRIVDFFAAGRSDEALPFVRWLPADAQPLVRRAAADPLGMVLHAARHGIGRDALQRRVLELALLRMAGQDPQQALRLVDGSLRGLDTQVRARIAWRAARQASQMLLPGTAPMFRDALRIDPALQTDPKDWEWALRAGLREADWKLVRRACAALRDSGTDRVRATYRDAVALRETGHVRRARVLWQGIAEPWSYYGQLATEALGQPVRVTAEVAPPDALEVDVQATRPGLRQALLLYRIGAYAPAAGQWLWSLRGDSDSQLHAAAQLACEQRAWLLCISASEHMKGMVDWRQRYVMPLRADVDAVSRSSGVGEAFLYGIMRQESRFAADIRSWAGAYGLMQLMPQTASWVAQKIGLRGFQAGDVTQVRTNLTLGSAYLGMLLQRFDGSQAMAAAGYNAGPGRPARWRAMLLPRGRGLAGAVFTESIPVQQTRDYVKRVLANATVYATLIGNGRQSLESRLALAQPEQVSSAQPMP